MCNELGNNMFKRVVQLLKEMCRYVLCKTTRAYMTTEEAIRYMKNPSPLGGTCSDIGMGHPEELSRALDVILKSPGNLKFLNAYNILLGGRCYELKRTSDLTGRYCNLPTIIYFLR